MLKVQIKSAVHANTVTRQLPIKTAFKMDETLTIHLENILMVDANTADIWNRRQRLQVKTLSNGNLGRQDLRLQRLNDNGAGWVVAQRT